MKIEAMTPGMVVFDCHSHRMGNTRERSLGIWEVRIESIDPGGRFVVASWNGNSPEEFGRVRASRWTAARPVLVQCGFGKYRREAREERNARISKKEVTP